MLLRALVISSIGMLLLLISEIAAQCDNKGASSSVGACLDNFRACSGFDTFDCNRANSPDDDVREVNQDFPTSCITKADSNCNEPLRECWIKVGCKWLDNKCKVSSSFGSYTSVKKRQSVACSPAT